MLDVSVVEGGLKKDLATAWLVDEMTKRRICCEDGAVATARQLSRWLSDIKCGAAPKATREAFNALNKEHGHARADLRTWPAAARQTRAKQMASRVLREFGNLAPRDLPAARR